MLELTELDRQRQCVERIDTEANLLQQMWQDPTTTSGQRSINHPTTYNRTYTKKKGAGGPMRRTGRLGMLIMRCQDYFGLRSVLPESTAKKPEQVSREDLSSSGQASDEAQNDLDKAAAKLARELQRPSRNPDRTVHADYPGMEIVRYNRAGKWYFEPTSPNLKRQAVTLDAAATQAAWALSHDGRVHYGLPGGTTFDRRVRKLVEIPE